MLYFKRKMRPLYRQFLELDYTQFIQLFQSFFQMGKLTIVSTILWLRNIANLSIVPISFSNGKHQRLIQHFYCLDL